MELKSEAIFPDLVAAGIEKWYFFNYDEFFLKESVDKITCWGKEIGISSVEIDIYRSFSEDDLKIYKGGKTPFSEKGLADFFRQEVIDNLTRAQYQETTFISDKEKVLIYLDKGCELVLVGISKSELLDKFEKEVAPYSNENLEEKIREELIFSVEHHLNLKKFKN